MFLNTNLKPKRTKGESNKFVGSRIMKVDEERDAVLGMIDNANNLDIKYELFRKWLSQNGHDTLLTEDRAIEDVGSFATHSDDSDSDIFLDTESDFPSIVLSSYNSEQAMLNADSDHTNNDINSLAGDSRATSPSLFSVSDYECRSSDNTVSSDRPRRKAKHKKGKAPPIPATAREGRNNVIDCSSNNSATFELNKNVTTANDTPSTPNRETADI